MMAYDFVSLSFVCMLNLFVGCFSEKTCVGTSNGLNNINPNAAYLRKLRKEYENCTIVRGNLELTHFLSDLNPVNFDFLSEIREITGYLLIAYNSINTTIPLPNLRIIWADETFNPVVQNATKKEDQGNYSVLIFDNRLLKNVYTPQLRAIVSGRVHIDENGYLCHWKNVDFMQLMGSDFENRLLISINSNFCKDANEHACHSSCSHCFGPSESDCQQIYRTDCAKQCSIGTCFETNSQSGCCHKDCLGGCTGPTNKDCIACRGVLLDDVCAERCPSHEVYNPRTGTIEEGQRAKKYQLNHHCVDECPSDTRIYKETCVSRCPTGYYDENATHCVPCNGPCPISCFINDAVTSVNIKDFQNCAIVVGAIEILMHTFRNSAVFHGDNGLVATTALKEADLEVMSNVTVVNGHVRIQSSNGLRSLNFLRNLREIRVPKGIASVKYALEISRNDLLTDLSIKNLRLIANGGVLITNNPSLCYADTLPWSAIVNQEMFNGTMSQETISTSKNMDKHLCEERRQQCHESCNEQLGCWGAGPKMCFECARWKFGDECRSTCEQIDGFFQLPPNQCQRCHYLCLTCDGPGSENCITCKHFRFKGQCYEACPSQNSYLPVGGTSECQECHINCRFHGCTGPGNFVGPGGCNKCDYAELFPNNTIKQCLDVKEPLGTCFQQTNASNYFWVIPPDKTLVEHRVCAICDAACKSCTSFGREVESHGCVCNKYQLFHNDRKASECVLNCHPQDNFYVQETATSKTCHACDDNCNGGCDGAGPDKCKSCRSKWLITDNNTITCLSACPEKQPFSDASGECSSINKEALQKAETRKQQLIISSVAAFIFLLLIAATIVAFVLRQRNRHLSKLNPPPDIFEMNPEAKPDLSQLRLIVECELKLGEKPLGTGAFGIVFKGIWHPEHEKLKVPVAIKVLHDSNPLGQKEMLDEASLMARMRHPNLIRLIGVCFGSRMMLITPLMPLGNLLEYVQKNRSKIGSVDLLRWCSQIAAGMEHLEKNRMVHRDLAARNVLVQTPFHVRITDFGLSKLLDYGEQELKVYEGRMPIKWLAIECITHRRFTHKSDVWAFGITAWELFTFGEKPYKDVQLKEICGLLLNGERLPQPKICTLDIFFILLKCWLVEPSARPSFSDLHSEFTAKLKDPGRYLFIEGDQFSRLPPCTAQQQHNLLRELVGDSDVCDSQLYLDDSHIPNTPATPTVVKSTTTASSTPRPSHRNQSTSSHRYASDPLKIRGLGDLDMSSIPQTDLENYLLPDSIRKSESNLNTTLNDVYTPVILGGNAASPTMSHHSYYNDLAAVKTATEFGCQNDPSGATELSSPSCSHHFSSPSTFSQSEDCPFGTVADNPEYLMNFDEAYCSQNRSPSISSFGETTNPRLIAFKANAQQNETAV